MPLCEKTEYVKEPTSLQCGQAVLAMLSGKSVNEIIEITGTERETTLKDMLSALDRLDIEYERERIQAYTVSDLPEICILSLETPRCWHWSLYRNGVFYDPEHGVLDDFPICRRKYYWIIKGKENIK